MAEEKQVLRCAQDDSRKGKGEGKKQLPLSVRNGRKKGKGIRKSKGEKQVPRFARNGREKGKGKGGGRQGNGDLGVFWLG